MNRTGISYCTHSWSPVTGCSPVGPGCANCWAKSLHDKRHHALTEVPTMKLAPQYREPFSKIQFHESRLADPLKARKPAVIATCFNGDLFHAEARPEWQAAVFNAMLEARRHVYLVLTKRPAAMLAFVEYWSRYVDSAKATVYETLPNVLLGWSAWDQASFDAGWKELRPLAAQGWRTWCSLEPLLGPINAEMVPLSLSHRVEPGCHNALTGEWWPAVGNPSFEARTKETEQGTLSWVVCGGESGKNARPAHPDWVRSLRDQCADNSLPFYFKQWGEWEPWKDITKPISGLTTVNVVDANNGGARMTRVGARAAGHLLDGKEYREFPADLRAVMEAKC